MPSSLTPLKVVIRASASLCAIAAALNCNEAAAQTVLPTIVVNQAAPARVAPRAPTPARAPQILRPSPVVVQHSAPRPVANPVRVAAPIAAPVAAPSFIPAGEQLGRGPSGVVGYVAQGTSTATKTNTKIMDIPQSVTILTQQQLQDRNSLTLNQALQYVPGVTVAQGEGQRDQLTIRGQPTTADFYTDGVRDDAEYYRDLYNIQAVEVLKGPSALIFGRGGGGGVVNRVTKKADGETLRALQVSTGSWGRKRVTFDVGQALTDSLAFRVNGLFEQSYSYRDYFNMQRWGINPTFTWKPFQKTFVTLSYEHYFDHRTMDRGIPSVNYNANPTILSAQALGLGYLFPGYPAPTGRSTFFGNPDVNYAKTDVDRVALMLDHTTDSGVNIKNQTVFAHYGKFYQNTFANNAVTFGPNVPPGLNCAGALPPCDQLSGYNNQTPRQNIFNQTDITYTWRMTPNIKHVFLGGMEFGNQRSDTNRNNARWLNAFTGGANINTWYGMPTVFLPVVFTNSNFRRHTDLDLAAGYVQDQISVTKYVDIIAGVRFDSYNLKFVNNLINPAPTPDNYWGQTLINNVGKWSPRFGVVFKPFEQLSLYGSYSRSFLPAAGDQFNTLTITQANLQPQGFENVEAGFKAELLPNLLLTGALYNLNRSNQPISVNAFYNVLTNTRTAGGELGLVGQVTKEWQVSLGYGNQHAYVTSSDRVPVAGVGPLFSEKGKVVPSVPQNTFSFWNKYDFSSLLGLAPGVFGVGSGVIYNAKFYAALDNAVVIPGYARWDGAVYVKFSENISGQVNVENILGANYYASAHNNNNIMPGAPRSAFVTVNAKF